MSSKGGRFRIVAAIVSAVVAGILMFGYISDSDVGVRHASGATLPAVEVCEIWLGRGSVTIEYGAAQHVHLSASGSAPSRGYSLLHDLPLEFPRWQNPLWGFSCNKLNTPSFRNYSLRLPIWFALLPCLIAPLRWWRKRGRVQRRGFEIEAIHR